MKKILFLLIIPFLYCRESYIEPCLIRNPDIFSAIKNNNPAEVEYYALKLKNYLYPILEFALIFAAYNGQLEIIKILLNYISNVNFQESYRGNYTALMAAAQQGYTDIVKLLLDKKANLNLQDSNGETALTYASAHGHVEIVNILLNKGANPNIQNNNNKTALDFAQEKFNQTNDQKYQKIVDLLKPVTVTTKKELSC